MIVKIKPLSQNEAWQGKRFKSQKYKQYEKDVEIQLLPIKIPENSIRIDYTFGFSNKMSDIDNPTKSFQDILCKKYGFNDNQIYFITIKKEIVKKGNEFIKFEISEYNINE